MEKKPSELLLALKQHLSVQRHDSIVAFDEVEQLYSRVEDQLANNSLEASDSSDHISANGEIENRTTSNSEGKGKAVEATVRFSSALQQISTDSRATIADPGTGPVSYTIDDLRKYISTYPWPDHILAMIQPLLESEVIYHVPNSLLYLQSESFPRQNDFLKAQILRASDGRLGIIKSLHEGSDGVISLWDEMSLQHRPKIPDAEDCRVSSSSGELIEINTSIPVVFAAVHLIFHPLVNMDDILRKLHRRDTSQAAFYPKPDPQLLRRSSWINLQYFRITKEAGELRSWEQCSQMPTASGEQIFVSRAAAVIVLWMSPSPSQQADSNQWKVLSMRSFGSDITDMDNENEASSIADGYDAFFNALRTQYDTAERALRDMSEYIRSPNARPDVIFNDQLRDELMFDDVNFSQIRMNFWLYEAMGNMLQSIRGMIDAYESLLVQDEQLAFLEDGHEATSLWDERMKLHLAAMTNRMRNLTDLYDEISFQKRETRSSRDALFASTTMYGRKATETAALSAASVQYIRFLALVNVIFLPMIFVASVFGMKNFDLRPNDFRPFAITLVLVCIPFWIGLAFSYSREAKAVWGLLRLR